MKSNVTNNKPYSRCIDWLVLPPGYVVNVCVYDFRVKAKVGAMDLVEARRMTRWAWHGNNQSLWQHHLHSYQLDLSDFCVNLHYSTATKHVTISYVNRTRRRSMSLPSPPELGRGRRRARDLMLPASYLLVSLVRLLLTLDFSLCHGRVPFYLLMLNCKPWQKVVYNFTTAVFPGQLPIA